MSNAFSSQPKTMQLRYGINESDSWWHFALGPQRERIWKKLRALDLQIIRIFVFDKHAPDPVADWPSLRSYIQAVLNVGATPFLTFAKFNRPFDDPRAVRWFAERCADIVWNCTEEWGGDTVGDWYWCVWNEPNNDWIGGGINFDQYRVVYEEVARSVQRCLAPWLQGRKVRIGGPSVEGFQPFWLDWVWRFLNEVDNSLIGFVNWHYYSDWRDNGQAGAPIDERHFQRLLMAQTTEYRLRGRQIENLLRGRSVKNVCGEWNVHSHFLPSVRSRFNQSLFGAAYGASALIQLMKGGVEAEMLWTGTDDACGYGVLDRNANPTPLYHARRLCSNHVRFGDTIRFPELNGNNKQFDAIVADDPLGTRSVFLVHLTDEPVTLPISALNLDLTDCNTWFRLDAETDNQVRVDKCCGEIYFAGYGVSVLTERADGT